MSCRCGRHNNDKENAPLAQLVEHLTLNQGVQGSSPWRCTQSTVFNAYGIGDGVFLCLFKIILNTNIPSLSKLFQYNPGCLHHLLLPYDNDLLL